MGTSIKLILVAMMLVPRLVSYAQGQEYSAENEATPLENDGTVAEDIGRFGVHFQVGGFMSLATNLEGPSKANYLITGDLSGLKWNRTESSFGLGLHLAVDENGHRIGIRGLWRTPLAQGRSAYFQIAPGVYFAGSDASLSPTFPGYLFEVELGLSREFAFVAAVEALPYENYRTGYNYNTDETIYEENGTATSLYFGAKIGQKPGIIATALGLIIGGIAVASSLSGSFGN